MKAPTAVTLKSKPSIPVTADKIVLRQSWLGDLAMCPERARQGMLGLSENTSSTSTAIGTAVHYGIEQCLLHVVNDGKALSRDATIAASLVNWEENRDDISRWNHTVDKCVEIIDLNSAVWWDEVRSDLQPVSVEHRFEIPLVTDQTPEIWLQGTMDLVQRTPLPIVDWKNPGRKPSAEWEKKRWSVQAAAYTYAHKQLEGGNWDSYPFEFVHLVQGKVHRTITEVGAAEWASLVALARSAATLIAADLPVWPLNMTGWHCSPKWCGAWSTCRGQHSGPDPWNQL